ncbi:MAG: biotin--[acetyl-CoA-carboxylase] ligase, partial [Planctomycetota bacterium]
MSPPWLIELPTCASTNSWAQERLATLAHGSCVYTRRQSAGRGQYDRSWCSVPGVLTCSFVLHLPPSPHTPRLALVAGLCVAHAVEDLLPGTRVMLKWPNDCHCRGRKLAGILCEGRSGRDSHSLCVGIGCNIDPDWDAAGVDPSDFATAPIALSELGAAPQPLRLIVALRRYLLEGAGLLAADAWPQVLSQIRA